MPIHAQICTAVTPCNRLLQQDQATQCNCKYSSGTCFIPAVHTVPGLQNSSLALIYCRLTYSLTKGHCSKDCEDALQHMISVHIRSRYAARDIVPDEIQKFAFDGPEDHKASVYMQSKLASLYDKYMAKVGLSRE